MSNESQQLGIEARSLRVVTQDGELLEAAPSYADLLQRVENLEIEKRKMEGELTGKRLRIAQLEKDHDAEARANGLWPTALGIFRYWQEMTGHDRTTFTTERFELLAKILRRGKDHEAPDCRAAIRGRVASDWHMKRGKFADRDGPVHDKFEQIFKSEESFTSCRNAAPADTQPFRRKALTELAAEVAGRVQERAVLIERELDGPQDPGAIATLLVEIDRLILEWRKAPLRSDAAGE